VKATGWTEDQIDAADATTCDWFLAFDELERQRDQQAEQQLVALLRRGG
jgi:hypothetical protein